MQFTQPRPARHHHNVPCSNVFSHPFSMTKSLFHCAQFNSNTSHVHPWPVLFPNSHTNFSDTNCMEQLLIHCANALESNDATLAQQILWVLNNIASSDGDTNQRLACAFLRALVARAARTGTPNMLHAMSGGVPPSLRTRRLSAVDLAGFLDLTPWHRFGFAAANAVILDAVEGFSAVHIIDLGVSHCMQIPTLIDSLSNRPDGPPFVRLTVAGAGAAGVSVPPILGLSYEELGSRLVNFARSRNVSMAFEVVPSNSSDGFDALIQQLQSKRLVFPAGEALVVNCHMLLHYIPDETVNEISNSNPNPNPNSNSNPNPTLSFCSSLSIRDDFLRSVRGLEPTIVTLVDEDADLSSRNLVNRLRTAFNYLWIPFDAIDTFLPRDSRQRQQYEADVCWKIENVVAFEGVERIERLEPKTKWVQRMKIAGFQSITFSEEAVSEVKAMLDEHAAGWGLKKDEGDLVLTWKGHNAVFATAWLPV